MKYFQADYVFPVSSPPIKDGIVAVGDDNTISAVLALSDSTAPASAQIEKIDGVLIPGFVNTHCHLELSHLEGKVDTGTTLLPFLVGVVSLRDTDQSVIDAAIAEQDRLMWEAGIQAVGDICNQLDTAKTKRESPIRYYSFVEHFDFLQPERAEATAEQYRPVYEGQPEPKSAVPHAPYTVSDPLYAAVNALNTESETISIHNQETPAESELFETGGGPFVEFFKGFGASLDQFEVPHASSLSYAIRRMDPSKRTLFVHNTMTSEEDIQMAQQWGKNGIYWATCPNANLYIENRLPRYQTFLDTKAKMTVGTDSLTSNWQLSILEELRAISKYQSYVPFETLLRWATLNGAEALQMEDEIGSLEAGKQAGLLVLEGLSGNQPEDFKIGAATTVRRIV